jgi:hypothetical protein
MIRMVPTTFAFTTMICLMIFNQMIKQQRRILHRGKTIAVFGKPDFCSQLRVTCGLEIALQSLGQPEFYRQVTGKCAY